MKTPRDILFARHQGTIPKLDAVRRSVVAELNNKDAKAQSGAVHFASACLCYPNKLWQELVWPSRRIWTGLSAVWILIFIINLSLRDNTSSVTGKAVRSGEAMMSLQTQQRWMNELLADRLAPSNADRPRNTGPRPRTEISETVCI